MFRPKILFLAHLLPWRLDDGGRIKSYHTLRILSERYDVTLCALLRAGEFDETGTAQSVPHRPTLSAEHWFSLDRNSLSNPMHAVLALVRKKSFVVIRDSVSSLGSSMLYLLGEEKYDAIHLDHLQMAQFLPDELPGDTRVILDQHNVEHRIIRRIAETPGANPLLRWYAGIEWRKLRDFEIASMRRADATFAVSDADRDAFLSLSPDLAGKVETVPIGVDTEYFAVAERDRNADSILSIGTMSWLPNVDAIRWFVSKILPLIRERKPGVRVLVVGANPAKDVVALGKRDPGVIVTGTVPDVRPYAKECGVFIVPLRSGSGVRVKILNALSMGLPVVSTTLGAEGIAVTHGNNILIADTPELFADAVCRVLDDREFADHLGVNGRALVEEQYTWGAVGKRLHDVYERVLETKSA